MRLKRHSCGFTLVELLLAAGLGIVFCSLAAQLLIGDLAHGSALARRLQLRRLQLAVRGAPRGRLGGRAAGAVT